MSSHNQQHKDCFKKIIAEKWDSLDDVSVAGSHVLEGTGELKRSYQPSERCNGINLVCCYIWSTPLCKQMHVGSLLKIITDKTLTIFSCVKIMFANGLNFPCPHDRARIPRSHLTGPCSATFRLRVLGVLGNGRAVPATGAPAASAAVQLSGVPAPSPLLCCPPARPSTGGRGQANRLQQETAEDTVLLMEQNNTFHKRIAKLGGLCIKWLTIKEPVGPLRVLRSTFGAQQKVGHGTVRLIFYF